MNTDYYMHQAMRTNNPAHTVSQRLANAALGLSGEFAEMMALSDLTPRDEAVKECGDCLWYCALACDAVKLSFPSIVAQSRVSYPFWQAVCAVGAISDIAKKVLFHDHPLSEQDRQVIANGLVTLIGMIAFIAARYESSFDEVMRVNIRKLELRYPDGFSSAASLNRSA